MPALLDDHPRVLVGVARGARERYFDGGWWDVTPEAANRLLRARVPSWSVRIAVGSGV